MPFDPVRDFAPIALLTRSPNILVVHPSLPVKSVRELIALAKARPGELNYGAGAIGASTHLASELFKLMAGVNIVHVPYKSSGPSHRAPQRRPAADVRHHGHGDNAHQGRAD